MGEQRKIEGTGVVLQPVSDPDNVPVRSVDRVILCGFLGGAISLTLATNRLAIDPSGNVLNDCVIAARLRMDIGVARALRDILDAQLDAASPRGMAN